MLIAHGDGADGGLGISDDLLGLDSFYGAGWTSMLPSPMGY